MQTPDDNRTMGSARVRSTETNRAAEVHQRFKDRTVFITGAGAGIGEAAARRFADEGANVAIVDINADDASRVAGSLRSALPLAVDVANHADVEQAFLKTVDAFGSIDIVFNNAGIVGEQQPLHTYTLENWRRVNSVNGDGAFLVMRHGIEHMLKSGGGSIINMSSTAALTAQTDISGYTYSKSGLAGLTRSAAVEYAKDGIRVNAIAATAVLTPMVASFIESSDDPEAFRAERENWNPIPGWPMPEDIAGVVAFLASDDARWITGLTLPVDGGYIIR